jgi:hypothetical protein
MSNPKWWNEEHESTWGRVKAAMKRDWEQTKADVSSKGRDLDQDVGDTVKQAAGKQPIPPISQANKNADDEWKQAEEGYRYGVGARSQYGSTHSQWDDRLEGKLSEEWRDMKSGRTWDEVKSAVRRGWDRVAK